MNKRQLSHEILNLLERLRIMQDLLKQQDFSQIPKSEILRDLEQSLKDLEEKFKQLAQ